MAEVGGHRSGTIPRVAISGKLAAVLDSSGRGTSSRGGRYNAFGWISAKSGKFAKYQVVLLRFQSATRTNFSERKSPPGPGLPRSSADLVGRSNFSLFKPQIIAYPSRPSNGGRSSMVEPQIVILVVAGSSPVDHPIFPIGTSVEVWKGRKEK